MSRSLWALDALNFCNAGIQTGLGPFMSIYYTAVRHWNPGQIGTLIASQSLSGIAVQALVGNWIDESHHKRSLTAIAGILVALGALGIALVPGYAFQIIIQLVIGLAVTVFRAATAAFALGLVKHDDLTGRVARNESLTHTGNAVFAVAAGVVGTLLALQGILLLPQSLQREWRQPRSSSGEVKSATKPHAAVRKKVKRSAPECVSYSRTSEPLRLPSPSFCFISQMLPLCRWLARF